MRAATDKSAPSSVGTTNLLAAVVVILLALALPFLVPSPGTLSGAEVNLVGP